ncbi:MAG: GNAT family N-acetyltransferase [Eubacterium sp.]|nr:GNAT family N-acetyltransferase [Eubacterium sp.]
MNIRRATENDMKQVIELLEQVDMVHHIIRPDLFNIGTKYTEDELREIFADDERPVFVAVDEEDRAMGYAFCMFKYHPDDNVLTDIRTLYIDDLCVYENLRGQHIGKAIYEYVLDYARGCGCYNVTLNVWEGNDSAKSFYENVGMKVQKYGMETIL